MKMECGDRLPTRRCPRRHRGTITLHARRTLYTARPLACRIDRSS